MLVYFNRTSRLTHFEDIQVSDWAYRIYQPARALSETNSAYVVIAPFESELGFYAFQHADVCITTPYYHPDFFYAVVQRKIHNKKTFIDITDNFFDKNHFYVNETVSPEKNIFQELNLFPWVDGLITTSHGLYLHFKKYHSNVKTIPNFIYDLPDFSYKHKKTIGWGGSITHKEDLLHLTPIVSSFLKKNPTYQFSMKGFSQNHLFETLKKNHPSQFEHEEPGNLYDYYRFIQEKLGMGIIYLKNNDFNFCRSDIKFIELSAHSVPTISGNYFNYTNSMNDYNSFIIHHDLEFADKLQFMVQNPEICYEKTYRAYQYVKKYRQERDNIHQRLHFWGIKPGLNEISKQKFNRCLELSKSINIVRINENALFKIDTIDEFFNSSETNNSLYYIGNAKLLKKKHPKHYIYPIMYALNAYDKSTSEKYLQVAYILNKKSPLLYRIYAQKCLLWGEDNRAKQYLLKSIEISPYDPDLYIIIAQKYIKNKNYNQAEKLLKKALTLNSYALRAYALSMDFPLEFKKTLLENIYKFIQFHPNNTILNECSESYLKESGKLVKRIRSPNTQIAAF